MKFASLVLFGYQISLLIRDGVSSFLGYILHRQDNCYAYCKLSAFTYVCMQKVISK